MNAITRMLPAAVLMLADISCRPAIAEYASHPPVRPLPAAAQRPLSDSQRFFVNAANGNDSHPGTESRAWKTIQHGVNTLKPGDTLVLRGGVFHENIVIKGRGAADAPITIRSHPGELAVIDGGLPDFLLHPSSAWEPVFDGARGEFRSMKSYPNPGARKDSTSVLGNFADSMIPLHGYRFIADLRSTNEYLGALEGPKTAQGNGVYSGPGVFHDAESGRIHIRLAHTKQACLGANNYTGETDPRRLRLVMAGFAGGAALTITNAAYVRIQDIVVRGAREGTIHVEDSLNITLDGVTSYGGSSALRVKNTSGLRALNSAFRGIAAPWTWRGSLKYRAIEARIVSASSWIPSYPGNRDFEFAFCEFTDSVDGVFVGNVDGVRIHHSLLDNISDDGIFLTHRTAYDGTTPAGEIHVYQNLLSRCLTTFAFGVGHGRQKVLETNDKTTTRVQTGPGVYIYRNVFDFRRPVHYQQPKEGEAEIITYGRTCGDHGSPAWEPMFIYHNTILSKDAPWRSYYGDAFGMGMGKGTRRRMFNNIFLHYQGMPGEVLPSPETDFVADSNLHWSVSEGVKGAETFLKRYRNGKDFAASKLRHPPGWTAADRYVDPKLMAVPEDWSRPIDARLAAGSPAVDAGVAVPEPWLDPLRKIDSGRPDAGALPVGGGQLRVGVHGRINLSGGQEVAARSAPSPFPLPRGGEGARRVGEGDFAHSSALRESLFGENLLPFRHSSMARPTGRPVAIVEGYPAFDSPLIQFALAKQGNRIAHFDRRWLPVSEYPKYRAVIHVGNLRRAQADQFVFKPEELPLLRQWLEGGGTLLLMRSSHDIFGTDEGRELQSQLTGVPRTRRGSGSFEPGLLTEEHPWLKTVSNAQPPSWLNVPAAAPILMKNGTNIFGDAKDRSVLAEIPVGKGRLIYVGWEISRALPHGRLKTTAEQEVVYEEQYRLLENIIRTIKK